MDKQAPNGLRYSETHEWVKIEDDGTVLIGITEYAQELLGELVYVELPDLESDFKAGAECCVVESVKAASDIYSPLSGRIIAINENLEGNPSLVNSDPYGAGWLFRLQVSNLEEVKTLDDAASYTAKISIDSTATES